MGTAIIFDIIADNNNMIANHNHNHKIDARRILTSAVTDGQDAVPLFSPCRKGCNMQDLYDREFPADMGKESFCSRW